jgi:hypothetical protein
VTYWKDMVPLFEHHCLQCHQEGGIGHVRLDLHAEAKEHAASIGYDTMARQMPPWDATSDGSCGDFRGSLALDDAQIELAAWVDGGAKEGKPGRVNVPAPDRLQNASDYALPSYAPVVQGGLLESLFDDEPDTLEPGKASVLYSFKRTLEQLDLEDRCA